MEMYAVKLPESVKTKERSGIMSKHASCYRLLIPLSGEGFVTRTKDPSFMVKDPNPL